MDKSQGAQSQPLITLRSNNSSQFSKQKYMTAIVPPQKKKKISPEAIIAEEYDELNRYIELLETKIKRIVQFNQAEVLVAYKNHFGRIRGEIQRFKQETLAQIKNEANVLGKMHEMQKQLTVFREEALRLFELVTEKDKIIEQLNKKIEELLCQKKYMNARMKQMMRADKQKHVNQNQSEQICSEVYKQTKNEEFAKTYYSIGIHSFKKSTLRDRKIKDRTFTASNYENRNQELEEDRKQTLPKQIYYPSQKHQEIDKIFKQKFKTLEPDLLSDIIKTAEALIQLPQTPNIWSFTRQKKSTQIQPKNSMRMKTRPTKIVSEEKRRSISRSTLIDTQIGALNSKTKELGQFFERCVSTVRRQVARRTGKVTMNFFKAGNSISLDEFKKIDFFRLIELAFRNDKVIKLLYDALVGHRF